MINSFIINDVCKNLKKEKCNHKTKGNHKKVFRISYSTTWKLDSSSFFRVMNEKGFNSDEVTRFHLYQAHRRAMKICFCFYLSKKVTDTWKQSLGAIL